MRNNYLFKKNLAGGFTLLEILIALFIFTIVSVIMVTALHTVLHSQAATEEKSTRLTNLQTALILISKDVEQTIDRPVINSKDGIEAFIGTADSVTFTHAGLSNPLGELQRSTLQRTQYTLEKHQLIRCTWPVLDQTAKTPANQRVLLDNVVDLRFEYLDENKHFQPNWPVPESKQVLPNAVRITFTINHWGKVTQLYLIPAQTPPKTTTNSSTSSTKKEVLPL